MSHVWLAARKQAGHRHVQRRSGTVIPRNIADLFPCTHEDGDTRMTVHVGDAAKCSYKNIMIRTVDTNIVVPAVIALKFIMTTILKMDKHVGCCQK